MHVLKVVAEGITTSFRYPHFMQGVHPTFEMPPPATIYGHICSTLGDWVPPEDISFAYRFTHADTFDDIEHIHVVASSPGKLPGTTQPKALEGAINPFKRSILFQPRLELYLNKPEWYDAFRSPSYPVLLGRSQDLFTYTSVSTIELVLAPNAYFEHTLIPYKMVFRTGRGYAVLMPRFLDYAAGRSATFARYVILKQRIHTRNFNNFATLPADSQFWIDPTSAADNGDHLGLAFHTFVGEYDDSPYLA